MIAAGLPPTTVIVVMLYKGVSQSVRVCVFLRKVSGSGSMFVVYLEISAYSLVNVLV